MSHVVVRNDTAGLLKGVRVSFGDVTSLQLHKPDGLQADLTGHLTRWVALAGSGDGQ